MLLFPIEKVGILIILFLPFFCHPQQIYIVVRKAILWRFMQIMRQLHKWVKMCLKQWCHFLQIFMVIHHLFTQSVKLLKSIWKTRGKLLLIVSALTLKRYISLQVEVKLITRQFVLQHILVQEKVRNILFQVSLNITLFFTHLMPWKKRALP